MKAQLIEAALRCGDHVTRSLPRIPVAQAATRVTIYLSIDHSWRRQVAKSASYYHPVQTTRVITLNRPSILGIYYQQECYWKFRMLNSHTSLF